MAVYNERVQAMIKQWQADSERTMAAVLEQVQMLPPPMVVAWVDDETGKVTTYGTCPTCMGKMVWYMGKVRCANNCGRNRRA